MSGTKPQPKRQKTTPYCASNRAAAPILSSTRSINMVPDKVWQKIILKKYMDLAQLSILRRCNSFFDQYWQNVMAQNVIRVPRGCPTVEEAVALAVIFSERKDYRITLLNIQIDAGIHEIMGSLFYGHGHNSTTVQVPCSHIAFIGKGADQTTIRGGFHIEDQFDVFFDALTITNINGHGLFLEGEETNVDVLECIVKNSPDVGVEVTAEATMTARQCEFTKNGGTGVLCSYSATVELHDCTMHQNLGGLESEAEAVVELHGTKTGIHSNKMWGVAVRTYGEVCIYLPSQHNTVYGNGHLGDFVQETDGRISRRQYDVCVAGVPTNIWSK